MSRGACTFRQTDLTRAVKAARAAGLQVTATVIAPDGSIRLEHVADPRDNGESPFDKWKAKRDAH
ncbi:MAG: hypothetical protein GC187_11885 [Alphaproteobacteria bacterium]|nr:hypothetical protein [Alphaproteobacteria bacterium]